MLFINGAYKVWICVCSCVSMWAASVCREREPQQEWGRCWCLIMWRESSLLQQKQCMARVPCGQNPWGEALLFYLSLQSLPLTHILQHHPSYDLPYTSLKNCFSVNPSISVWLATSYINPNLTSPPLSPNLLNLYQSFLHIAGPFFLHFCIRYFCKTLITLFPTRNFSCYIYLFYIFHQMERPGLRIN